MDDDRETIAELLLMDDDTLLVNEELLKGLDEELDSFLKELLENNIPNNQPIRKRDLLIIN